MEIKTKNKDFIGWPKEGLIILLCTSLTYFACLTYQRSFLAYFGIDGSLIDFNLIKNVAPILFLFLFHLLGFYYVSSYMFLLPKRIKRISNGLIIIFAILLIYSTTVAMMAGINNYFFLFLIIFLFFIFLILLASILIFPRLIKKVLSKFKSFKEPLTNLANKTLLGRFFLDRFLLCLIGIMIYIFCLTSLFNYLGYNFASDQEYFNTITTENKKSVVISVSNDHLIAIDLDANNEHLAEEFYFVSINGSRDKLKIHAEKLGPFNESGHDHYKNRNAEVINNIINIINTNTDKILSILNINNSS